MFLRKLNLAPAVAALLWLWPAGAQAVDYRPSQAELNGLEFIDWWPGNGATLDSKVLVPAQGFNPNPGVKYTFDTGRDPNNPNEGFSRTQFETPAGTFMPDLLGYDNFAVNFLSTFSSTFSTLQAQMWLRFVGGTGELFSGPVTLSMTDQTRVALPISSIPIESRSQITSFGFEVFAQNPFDNEVDSMVTAYQTPLTNDVLLFSWETPNNPATPAVDERFEGWTIGFDDPSFTTHAIYDDPDPGPGPPGAGDGKGATHGSHALEITRTYDGGLATFKWGSQYVLAAGGTGDYNDDGNVDAGDYVRWRNNLGGPASTLKNRDPANMATTVNASHYANWKVNYGYMGGTDPIQQQIDELVALIEDPLSLSLAFDVTINPNPDAVPQYVIFDIAIQDSDGVEGTPDHFFQGNQVVLDSGQTAIDEETTYSIEMPLADFYARDNGNPDEGLFLSDIGLYDNTPFLAIDLSSNLNVPSYTYQIDNFRILQLAVGGSGGVTSVPEPSSGVLGGLACLVIAAFRCRRPDSHGGC